jgi:hypothetical protein
MMKQSKWRIVFALFALWLLSATAMLSCSSSGTSDDPADDGQPAVTPGGTGAEEDNDYFPIAVWLQQPELAQAYQAIGINLYIGLWQGPTEAQLAALQAAGMPVICSQNDFALQHLGQYGDTIVGWMHDDEPDNAQWNSATGSYDPCIDPSVIVSHYNDWESKDSTRSVYLNFGQGVANIDWIGRGTCTGRTDMYPQYIEGSDILSFDIYPVTSDRANVQGNLWYVAEGVENLRLWSNDEKPVWTWIETTHINSQAKPTPSQVETEVWMALIHGARGIGYFCHEWYPAFNDHALLDDTAMAQAVSRINAQITELAPVLNRTALDDHLLVGTSDDVPLAVMYRSRQNQYYIFAVNMRDEATTATIDISSISTVAQIEVLYENRSIDASSGIFQDQFIGYAVHRYRLDIQ